MNKTEDHSEIVRLPSRERFTTSLRIFVWDTKGLREEDKESSRIFIKKPLHKEGSGFQRKTVKGLQEEYQEYI